MTRATSFVLLLALLVACAVATNLDARIVLEADARIALPDGWTRVGPAAAHETVELIVAVTQNNVDTLQMQLEDVSSPSSENYGKYMTLEEVEALLAPSTLAVSEVTAWLLHGGLSIDSVTAAGAWIKAKGTVAAVQELLQVELSAFSHASSDTDVIRAMELYSVPSHVAHHIDLVGGVIRFPAYRKEPAREFAKASETFVTTPQSIQSLYDITIPASSEGNLQAVASFLGQYYSPKDLQRFETRFGLPSVPIQQTYGYNDASKPGTEASLDVQFLMGVSNCSIDTWVISTNGTRDYGNEPFLDFLTNLPNLPQIPNLISMSYQDLEYTVTIDYANRCDTEFMKYSMQGVTFITGSGDWGVGCVEDDECSVFTSDWPSSSTYVVSTGATTILDLDTLEEVGVSFSSGGFSNYFGMPTYQKAVVQDFLNQTDKPDTSLYNTTGRAFPDISAIGTGFYVYVHGFPFPVAGTSASTPTFGSMLSMINSLRINQGLPTLGWVQPFLYEAGAAGAFKDITDSQPQAQGCCSDSFDTVPGWDPYTGMGVPKYPLLSSLALSSDLFPSFA